MTHILHIALLTLVVIREGQHAHRELRTKWLRKGLQIQLDPLPMAPFCYYLVELAGQLIA